MQDSTLIPPYHWCENFTRFHAVSRIAFASYMLRRIFPSKIHRKAGRVMSQHWPAETKALVSHQAQTMHLHSCPFYRLQFEQISPTEFQNVAVP
jgi:hypothetical protein